MRLGFGEMGARGQGSLPRVPTGIPTSIARNASLATRGRIMVGAYLTLALLALGLGAARGESPFITTPLLPFGAAALVATSVVLGLTLAAVTVLGTRGMVRRFAWARQLHETLRPAVKDASTLRLLGVAVASGFGEELFFRGLLVPVLGVVASSLLFGALHQTSGKARFVWAAWATLMGLVFAGLFQLTGSLAGSIVAHVAINAANLVFLRDTSLEKPRKLGGLLRV